MASRSINIPIQQYFALLLSLHSNISKLSITGDTTYTEAELLQLSSHSHQRDLCEETEMSAGGPSAIGIDGKHDGNDHVDDHLGTWCKRTKERKN